MKKVHFVSADNSQFASIEKLNKANKVMDWGRPLGLSRPCSCGCSGKGPGYISGGDKKGAFFSIKMESEEMYQAVARVFRAHGLKADD